MIVQNLPSQPVGYGLPPSAPVFQQSHLVIEGESYRSRLRPSLKLPAHKDPN